MEIIKLPKYVYKYINWEREYHKKILLENEIFFTSSRNFNDPFDSTVHFRYDYGNDEQILNMYIDHIRHDNLLLTDDEVRRVAINELRENDIRNPERIQYNINVQREIAATKFGIFSTSIKYDNILMWSHYSNNHKGICIRINCEKFLNFIEKECDPKGFIIYWNYVEYAKEYPLLNPFEFDKDENYVRPLLIKSSDWRYEEEFRFILFDYPNKKINIPFGIIDQVILGCRTISEDKNKIIEYAKENKLGIVQTALKQNKFELEFSEQNV